LAAVLPPPPEDTRKIYFSKKIKGKLNERDVEMTQYFVWFIPLLSLVQVILLIVMIVVGGFESFERNPFGGPPVATLVQFGGKHTELIRQGQVWRLITPIFLHSGIVHLLINLCMQIMSGLPSERYHGAHFMIPLYLLCGLFGNALSALFLPSRVTVGVSSSLCGLFGLMLVDVLQNHEVMPGWKQQAFCLVMHIVVIVAIGAILPSLDNWAHSGGFVMGLMIAIGFSTRIELAKRKNQIPYRVISAVAIVIALGVVLVLLFTVSGDFCPVCANINCIQATGLCDGFNANITDLINNVAMMG